MSEQQKDYSLLRPFDLEAAKRGDRLCDVEARVFWSYVAGPDSLSKYILKVDHAPMSNGEFTYPTSAAPLRMAPLCWVEGKPVYKGDVLYDKNLVGKRIVVGRDDEYLRLVTAEGEASGLFRAESLTWTPPKVKREGWVNIYPAKKSGVIVALASHVYSSKAAADAVAAASRIDCISIEWEEPAGLENGK